MQALTAIVTHRAAKHSCLHLTNLTWFVAVCISSISIHSSRVLVGIIRNTLAGQNRLFTFMTQPLGTSLWLWLRGGDPGLLRALLSRPALLRAMLIGHVLLWDPCLVQPLLQSQALPSCLARVQRHGLARGSVPLECPALLRALLNSPCLMMKLRTVARII